MEGSDHSCVSWEAVVVKQEPEEYSADLCGVSEAGAREGLYSDRELKHEAALEPEVFPDNVNEIFIKKEAESVKIEYECEPSAGPAALYAEHKVKVELQLDPESPQLREAAHELCVSSVGARPQACGQQPPAPQRHTRRTRTAATHAADSENTRPHPICNKRFTRSLKGMDSQTAETPHSSEIDSKQYRDSSDLKRHSRTHTDEKRYSCEICKKHFTQLKNLRLHKRIHTDTKPHACKICKKHFKLPGNLKAHKLIHTDTKPYACDVCTKKFRKSNDLKRHSHVHTGEKPHSCDVCRKQFTLLGSLKVHKLIHTNTKPYSCEFCTKKFTQLTSLNVHTRVHTKIKPYTCETCLKQFSQSTKLKLHRMIHTGEKPYTCDMCMKQFSRKCYVILHIRRHARKEQEQSARDAV